MEFVILDLMGEDGKEERKKGIWEHVKVFREAYCNYLKNKGKLIKGKYEIYGIVGEKWTIPITEEIADGLGEEYLNEYRQNVLRKHPDVTFILSDTLRKRLVKEDGKRWTPSNHQGFNLTFMLVFPELFEKAVKRYRISCAKMHLVVVDSGKNDTACLLELFLGHLNFLTIITERPDDYQTLVDRAYLDTGLVVEVVGTPMEEEVYGEVVFDLKGSDYTYYKRMRGVQLVFDFMPSAIKHQYVCNKFGKIPIIYNVGVTVRGERVKNIKLFEEILKIRFPILRLLEMGEGILHYDEIRHIKEKMKIHMEWEM